MVAFKLVIVPVERKRSVPRSIIGPGSILIIAVFGKPMHPLAIGVTVIVALTGDEPVLFPENAPILPVPFDAKPIDGVLFVQLKLVPATALEKMTAVVLTWSQSLWLAGCTTSGVGFTIKVKFCEGPEQPFANGAIVI